VCMAAAALLISVYGQMPPPGTVILVPKEIVDRYTPAQQAKAERCVKKFNIALRVQS